MVLNNDTLGTLPTVEEFADGLLVNRIIRSLKIDEKIRLKSEVEKLAADHNMRVHDVVDHLGINRIAYFDFIDTVSAEPKLKRRTETRTRANRTMPLSHLTPAQKLAVFHHVDDAVISGTPLDIACKNSSISERDYTTISSQRIALRAEATGNGHADITDFRTVHLPRFREVHDDEERRTVCESVHLLCAAFQCKIQQACLDLGITYSDFTTWSGEQHMHPIFPITLGRKTSLPVHKLRISTEGKVHLVQRSAYIAKHTSHTQDEVFERLGYQPATKKEWAKTTRVVSKEAEKRKDGVLHPRQIDALSEKAGVPKKKLQTWLKTFNLRDLGTQVMAAGVVISTDELVDLWTAYTEDKTDTRSYNQIVVQYLPLVTMHARSYLKKLPDMVTLDDLEEFGSKGLMDAVRLYDPSVGTKFTTYCPRRIIGSMKDGLRERDWIPRMVRAAESRLKKAHTKFKERQTGMEPSIADLAKIMEVSNNEVINMMRLTGRTRVESLDAIMNEGKGNDQERYATVSDGSEKRMSLSERKELMELLLVGLNETEAQIITMYYQKEMKMAAIGDELDLSESRISQMHSDIIERMKDRISRQAGTESALGQVHLKYHVAGKRGGENEDIY